MAVTDHAVRVQQKIEVSSVAFVGGVDYDCFNGGAMMALPEQLPF
jgi:hypothetical protein